MNLYLTHAVIAFGIIAAWHVALKFIKRQNSEEILKFFHDREMRQEKALTNFLGQIRELVQRTETAKQQLVKERLNK